MTEPLEFPDRFPELFKIAYKAAYIVLGTEAESEDVAQEALARAYVSWAKINGFAPAWVTKVSMNLSLDIVRKRRSESTWLRRQQQSDLVGSDEGLQGHLDIVSTLRDLPRRQREAVFLRYVMDMSEGDTARCLGIAQGTVKAHTFRGLHALRQLATTER